jgi:hypothetical protein
VIWRIKQQKISRISPERQKSKKKKNHRRKVVLVFYCYITNHYKVNGVKQPTFIFLQFCRSDIWVILAISPVSHWRLKSKCWLGWAFIWRPWGKFCFWAHSVCWQKSGTSVVSFSQRPLSAPRSCLFFLSSDLLHLKGRMACPVLMNQNLWLFPLHTNSAKSAFKGLLWLN